MSRGKGSQRLNRYAWLFGFFGFFGLTYFQTGNPMSLFYFSFFSFFAYYFIGRLAQEMKDERYEDNARKAKLKTASIPLIALFFIGFFSGFPFFTKVHIILACALAWAATILSYAYLFWYYDTH